ncbi:MAG: putative metal-binding motif-containing protein [Myxococcota bacterium]
MRLITIGWFVGSAAAQQVTVCANTCDYGTLFAATLDGNADILVKAGVHPEAYTSSVWLPDTRIEAEADASFVAPPNAPLLYVEPSADRTTIVGIELVTRGLGGDGTLASVHADHTTIERPVARGWLGDSRIGLPALIDVQESDHVSIVDPTLVDAIDLGFLGQLVSVSDADVEIVGGTFEASQLPFGAISVNGGTLTVTGATFRDVGVAVTGYNSDLALTDVVVTVTGPWTFVASAVTVYNGSLDVHGGSMTGLASDSTYANAPVIGAYGATSLEVTGTVFPRHEVPAIAAALVDRVELTGVVFTGVPGIGTEGAVALYQTPSVDVRDSWFCDESAGDGAALLLSDSCDDGCRVERSVFVGDLATDRGVIYADAGELSITSTTMIDNRAQTDGSVAFAAAGATVDLEKSVIVRGSSTGGPVAGPIGRFADNALDAASAEGLDPLPNPNRNRYDAAPVWSDDRDNPCGEPVLLADDPANDWLIEHRSGAFVGCRIDGDGDGYGGAYQPMGSPACDGPREALLGGDCDDADGAVHPGADDLPYDGLDADCAGDPDDDLDGDGAPFAVDCDDLDPAVIRCESPAFRLAGGSCATGGTPAAPFGSGFGSASWLGLVGVIAIRRAGWRRRD